MSEIFLVRCVTTNALEISLKKKDFFFWVIRFLFRNRNIFCRLYQKKIYECKLFNWKEIFYIICLLPIFEWANIKWKSWFKLCTFSLQECIRLWPFLKVDQKKFIYWIWVRNALVWFFWWFLEGRKSRFLTCNSS